MSIELIAHRCGTDKYPELTLEAAKYSLMHGFSYVEMDIRFTKDDVPVICHDNNALRLFGSFVEIGDILLDDFIKFKYACDDRYHSITLEDVLTSGVEPILFHVKESGKRLNIILESIKKNKYEDKVIIGLTNNEDINTVKKFNSNTKILGFIPSRSKIKDFIDNGADIIRLWEDWVNNKNVEKVIQSGKKVWVMACSNDSIGYTNKENLLKWENMNIDGIIINEINDCKFLL